MCRSGAVENTERGSQLVGTGSEGSERSGYSGPGNFETFYQLYANQSPVGAGQTGNGSALYYTWSPGNPGVSLFVRAIRTTECGTDSLDVPVPVAYHPVPDLDLPFSVSDNNICAGEAIDIVLSETESDVYYGLVTDGSTNPYLQMLQLSGQIRMETYMLPTITAIHSAG